MISYSLRGKRRNISNKVIVIVAAVVLALILLTAGIRQIYTQNLRPVSASQKTQLVTIPIGSSVQEIGSILQKAGVIRAGWAFEWYARNHDLRDKMQAGTYNLRPNQSVSDIAAILTQGKVATDLVTILPGQRLDQIKKAFVSYGFKSEDVEAAFSPDLYVNHPALVDKPHEASLEGYLYPESFQKTTDTKPETIIRASLDEMQKHLTPALRAGIVKQGLTVHQGVTLASIIEQEVSNNKDRATVAQVFLRRLRENRPLQSDVTVFYAATITGKQATLDLDSPYNTYKNAGLPPGPISNVSTSSLEAVSSPAGTDYLYFVAGDDGKTYFSHTIEEHEQLTKQHCKKLCNTN
jgi:UPF0755 protein